MKINLKEKLKSLEGKDLVFGPDTMTVGFALANILIQSKAGGKMKLYALSQKAYNDTTLEIDEADKALIKNILEADETSLPLVSGQLLTILENTKAEEK